MRVARETIMKKLVLLLLLFSWIPGYSQGITEVEDYMAGEFNYCETNDSVMFKSYSYTRLVLSMTHQSDMPTIRKLTSIFYSHYKADSLFCDAAFFTGYTLLLQNKINDAIFYYHIADSLSNNTSLLYKLNLASTAMLAGAVEFSRKKYEEAVKYFPTHQGGYFGIANTAVIIGDYKNGIAAVNDGIRWCNRRKVLNLDEAYLLKGVLYTLDGEYAEGKEFLNKATSYKNNDLYYIYYSLNLLWESQASNDDELKKEAKKYYKKIDWKSNIPAHIKQEFGAFNKTED